MKIQALHLHTDQLLAQQAFFTETLGLPLLDGQADRFTVRVGWTELTFEASSEAYPYHYCFLIPANQLIAAHDWLRERWQLIEDESGNHFFHYEAWNADAFYFYDAAGNVAECIVRYDLENAMPGPFDEGMLLCVNEIGLGSGKPVPLHDFLEALGSPLWKGNKVRFGTNGTQEGLFLLPNYQLKPHWFPTEVPVKASPLHGRFEVRDKAYDLHYVGERIQIEKLE